MQQIVVSKDPLVFDTKVNTLMSGGWKIVPNSIVVSGGQYPIYIAVLER
jgi:hypothetical protein